MSKSGLYSKTRCPHLRIFLQEVVEEVDPDSRTGRVTHIAHPTHPTHDAPLSIPCGVRCVEIFLERVEKRGEECVADNTVLLFSGGEFGQDFRWDRVTQWETQLVLLPAQVHVNHYDILFA